jgi:hypothetical protein
MLIVSKVKSRWDFAVTRQLGSAYFAVEAIFFVYYFSLARRVAHRMYSVRQSCR